MKPEIKKYKNCIHFKNAQRELNYWKSTGFCTNPEFKFTTVNGRIVGVYDRENIKDTKRVTGNPSHDIESVSFGSVAQSRYSLAVSEDFGCIYYEKK